MPTAPAASSGGRGAGAGTVARRSARIAKLGAIVLISLIVALLAAELILRAFHLAPRSGLSTMSSAEFARLPGIFTPNESVLDEQIAALPFRIVIDSLGFRGSDIARQKPEGLVRILVVGDSHVFGDFVQNGETLPAQLQDSLSRRCRSTETVNAGLGGSTIVDQMQMLRRVLPLSPDLVVLVFSENDVTDLASQPSMWNALAANREAKSRFPLSLVYPVLKNTALWTLSLRAAAIVRTRRTERRATGADGAAEHPDVHAARARLRERYAAELRAFRDTLAARSVPLVFVLFPSHFTYAASTAEGVEQLEWARAVGEQAGVRTLSLLAPLRVGNLPKNRIYLLPHDGHPTPLAYGIAAGFLADQLARQSPLSERCRIEGK